MTKETITAYAKALLDNLSTVVVGVVQEGIETVLSEPVVKELLLGHNPADDKAFLAVSAEGSGRQKPVLGDILCVRRLGETVEHYGVFIDQEHVIHYAPSEGEFGFDMSIRETSLGDFLLDEKIYYICLFPEDYEEDAEETDGLEDLKEGAVTERRTVLKNFFSEWGWSKEEEYILFSPEETVERARARLGESNYNVLTNNCEHFALWCKTNISESWQIKNFIEQLCKLPMQVVQVRLHGEQGKTAGVSKVM